jgi:hypothetical protein
MRKRALGQLTGTVTLNSGNQEIDFRLQQLSDARSG